MTATAEQLHEAANAPAPDPNLPRFNRATGALVVGGKTYRAKRYTKKLGRELFKMAEGIGLEAAKAQRAATNAGDDVTDDHFREIVMAQQHAEESVFDKVRLLFADDHGTPPSEDELDELTYQDARAAADHATADPTKAATRGTSV